MLQHASGAGTRAAGAGAHHKRAEIGIVSKLEDPVDFFGPGLSAPFNPGNTEFTLYLISLFGNVVKLLGVDQKSEQASVVIDSGCGYAWTSEWLAKSGLETIGVDICRAYLEVGAERMGPSRPHLVVADVESLPIAADSIDAVLAYESFHHVPDRARAMACYAKALKEAGTVVLAEPGEGHESADVSIDAMTKYGILEKGMELEDVAQYVAGLPFAPPEQVYVMHASAADLEGGLDLPSAWRRSIFHGNVFRIRKQSTASTPRTPDTPSWLSAKQRLIAELRETKQQRDQAQADLAVARHTVGMMKRSVFWRAREAWVRLASLLGSDRGGVPADLDDHPRTR
jgi:SAM-dependent methyltransferase